eukprot:TRINITY_DN62589_c0_g1_i1.p1 TRINITY_DN62589_c0_g1~~TRINITY_DN62589_c0_g1_i1.p1  ORF type:complete len:564 (+),score=67.81 TRINITY_DN62589_c0_g1_i1:254-1693(+)
MAEDSPPSYFRSMWSLFVSGFAIGGIIGTAFFPTLANKFGRKRSIIATTPFLYAACYLIAYPSSWVEAIIGRICVGIGAGGACSTVPTYVAEISPKELRGTLGTIHQLMITLGIVVAQGLSTARFHLLGTDELWHFTLLVPFFCTTFLLVTLPFCAESPLFLLREQGEEAAKDALRWFRPKCEGAQKRIYREVRHMREELSLSDKNATLRDVVKDELLWKPLLIGSVVNLSMQFSGIDAVFYYSTRVFLGAGFSMDQAQVSTTGVGLCNLLVTIPAMVFMDKAGRKVIQITGLSGMSVSFVLMTVALVNGMHTLAVIAMVFVICFFAFGPGCIAWFIMTELVPIHARGLSVTIALLVNWAANWFIAYIFPLIHDMLGKWTFMVFAVSCATLALYTAIFLPETKGKTVMEIRESFSSQSILKAASEPNIAQAVQPIGGLKRSGKLGNASAPNLKALGAPLLRTDSKSGDMYVMQTIPSDA